MYYYLGIDLGTTGVKAVLVDEKAAIVGTAYRSYPILIPSLGFAEQDPDAWWSNTAASIIELLNSTGVKGEKIRGIGFSGQMHGAVVLDKDNRVLCPAIIHCDQRAVRQRSEIENSLSLEELGKYVQNRPHSGFQLLSLMWLKENRPEVFDKIHRVLLPKDYLRLKLTGIADTEVTDACSTLMFDNRTGTWCPEILSRFGIPSSILPDCHHRPQNLAGYVTADAAAKTGLKEGTPVAYGAGDQVAQAVGNNLLSPGKASITIGTSGQVFIPTDHLVYDKSLRTNVFTHAPEGSWYVLGAVLNACLALNWFTNGILGGNHDVKELDRLAMTVPPGSDGLIFLPYLSGERVPLMDEKARAGFIGLTLGHGLAHMARAILEGVVFSLYDAMNTIRDMGVDSDYFILSGGGTKSALWPQIVSDVFGCRILLSGSCEQAALGAAKFGMAASGNLGSLEDITKAFPAAIKGEVAPDMGRHSAYEKTFSSFKSLYEQNREYFHSL